MDILGYSKLIENNPIDEVVRLIYDCVLDIGPKTRENILKIMDQHYGRELSEKYVHDTFKRITSSVFSDTLIFTTNFIGLNQLQKCSTWWQFNVWMIDIFRNLFINGLPCKAVVDYGDYYHSIIENGVIIAGEIFSRCHNLLSVVSAACMAFPMNAANQCRLDVASEDPNDTYLDQVSIDGPLPYKPKCREEYKVPSRILGYWKESDFKEDVVDFIESNFMAHNKSLDKKDSDILQKLSNTQQIMLAQLKK